MRLAGWSARFLVGLLGSGCFKAFVPPLDVAAFLGIVYANPTVPPSRLVLTLMSSATSIVLLSLSVRLLRPLLRFMKRPPSTTR